MDNMTTIYDIAKEVGLSPSTVSKRLNNYKGVSESAKTKIDEAILKLKYVPNLSARMMLTKKSYMIGVLFKESLDVGFLHPHFSEILESFRNELEFNGYDTVFLSNRVGNDTVTYLEHCKYRGLDGIMLSVSSEDDFYKEQILELSKSELPKVSIEDIYDSVCSILSENIKGTKEALEYLYFLGHRNIVFVRVGGNSVASKEREIGYKEFLKENNLEYNDQNIINVSSYSYKAGFEVIDILLKRGIKNMPTAIFCVCDDIALGLIDSLSNYNILVPDDVSVIGFDDVQIAKLGKLTTVRQNRKMIGITAAKKLISVIKMEDMDMTNITITTELIIRDTCKRI